MAKPSKLFHKRLYSDQLPAGSWRVAIGKFQAIYRVGALIEATEDNHRPTSLLRLWNSVPAASGPDG
jgi:hypothetical protein